MTRPRAGDDCFPAEIESAVRASDLRDSITDHVAPSLDLLQKLDGPRGLTRAHWTTAPTPIGSSAGQVRAHRFLLSQRVSVAARSKSSIDTPLRP